MITHPRLFDPPHSGAEACEALSRVLESPSLTILSPGDRFWPLFDEAIREADAVGNLAFDAQIAAACLEAGVSALLCEDRDFARFKGLRTVRL